MKYLTLLILLATPISWAEMDTRPGLHDGRVVTLQYKENEVYTVNAHYTQVTIVRFHEDEKFISTRGGDALGWDVVEHEHMLFLKPIAEDADTNMNVVTQDRKTGELRYYAFELNALPTDSNEMGTWSVEIQDPRRTRWLHDAAIEREVNAQRDRKAAATLPIIVQNLDFDYEGDGDWELSPKQIFDDGKFTYFLFEKQQALPLLVSIEDGKQGMIINRHEEGLYTVIHQISNEYLLRLNELEFRIHYSGDR